MSVFVFVDDPLVVYKRNQHVTLYDKYIEMEFLILSSNL
jgi:hypothetical protein